MSELELYKFVHENALEYNFVSEDEIYLFVPFGYVDELAKILTPTIYDGGGLECSMHHNYFCFEMNYICEYYGIDSNKIFKGD